MKRTLIIIAFIGIIITGCRPWGIKGNGKVVVEEREITGFDRVSISGIFYAKIVAGENFKVKIRAEENLLKYISTFGDGNYLIVDTRRNLSPRKKIQIKITLPELVGIESSGVNKILAKNIDAEKFYVDLSGAGEIVLKGEADYFDADISGASKLVADEFNCTKVKLDVSGASRASVYAEEKLYVDASGASSVRFAGNPSDLDTDVSGVSSVKRMREDD